MVASLHASTDLKGPQYNNWALTQTAPPQENQQSELYAEIAGSLTLIHQRIDWYTKYKLCSIKNINTKLNMSFNKISYFISWEIYSR